MRVLIIDDEPQIRELLRDILASRDGFEVHCAQGGADGIEQASVVMPDVVLLDLSLDDMSGEDVWTEIFRNGSCSKAVIMTGHVTELADFGEGVCGILSKPFLPDRLFAVLANAMAC